MSHKRKPSTILEELRQHPGPQRTRELQEFIAAQTLSARDLSAYHEYLLFTKAYPRSKDDLSFACAELERFPTRVEALPESDRERLSQSGIAGTTIYYPYDEPMARWLSQRLPDQIEVDWDAYEEKENDPIGQILPLLAEPSEGDALDDPELTTREFVEGARGKSTGLHWLLERMAAVYPTPLRQQSYNSMEIPLRADLMPPGPSRTLADDGHPSKPSFWDPCAPRPTFDLLAEIRRPLRIPKPVERERGHELLNLVYATLLPRLRELYPATHGNPEEVYDIPLERGVRVVLWFMKVENRLPLEAGWGLLVLKNHVPIGYGAGGMLYDRAEIAINVFDTFRGGEAAWLYSQYARIFYALCGATWLVTRRYQIGYENEEGIASGSYWFYDKLGFRSVDPDIRKLADRERAFIAKHKGYRSGRPTLKKLCGADVVLSLDGEPAESYREFPLGKVGRIASKFISETLGGDRSELEDRVLALLEKRLKWPTRTMTPDERSRIAQMGLFVLAIPDHQRWSGRKGSLLLELCRTKGSEREADYARAMKKNSEFFEALRQLAC